MGELADRQAEFTKAIFEFGFRNNPLVLDDVLYRMRLSFSERTPEENKRVGGHPRSTHLSRLAVDLIVDRSTDNGRAWAVAGGDDPIWHLLHERWELDYNGAEIIRGDAGHFSFEYRGVR